MRRYTPGTREIVLAELATRGPCHFTTFSDYQDRTDYDRFAALCSELFRAGLLVRTAPGTYDLGPDAPAWAVQLRTLTAECAALRKQLAEREAVR